MPFWKLILAGALNAAAQSSASAIQSGADVKTTGAAAGVGALAGAIAALLAHPVGQHPAVQAAAIPPVPPVTN